MQFIVCVGGRGVTARVYLATGGMGRLTELYNATGYPNKPNYTFIYPSYQSESFRRYLKYFMLIPEYREQLLKSCAIILLDMIDQGKQHRHSLHHKKRPLMCCGFNQIMRESCSLGLVQISAM